MSTRAIPTPRIREFLPQEFKITVWSKLKPYYKELLKRPIDSVSELKRWILDESELDALFEEELHRRYISKLANQNDTRANDAYEYILEGIGAQITETKHQLYSRLLNEPLLNQLDTPQFGVYIRSTRLKSQIFRKENKLLNSEIYLLLETLASTNNRILVFDSLFNLRNQIANNAGFNNYKDFRFTALERTDYNSEDCHELHESVADAVCPIINNFNQLALTSFANNTAFTDQHHLSIDKLLNTTIQIFDNIHPELGACLKKVHAVGSFSFTKEGWGIHESLSLPLTGISHIHSTYNGSLPELFKFFQACGIAVQQMLSSHHFISRYRHVASEFNLLISKVFELLVIEKANLLFKDKYEIQKVKHYLLQQRLSCISEAVMLDRFEHWLYKHPRHTDAERQHAWLYIHTRFNTASNESTRAETTVPWQEYESIFNQPFKAIETAVAQLGAFAFWRQYKTAPTQTLEKLIKVLKAGGRLGLKESYELVGIPLDFSKDYLSELMAFVRTEIQG